MKYMLLIYSEEVDPAEAANEASDPDYMRAWFDYTADMDSKNVNLGGEALQPSATATTVRVRDGQRSVTDGPFAETKEVLGGYYLIDVDSLDEAIQWAAECPAADYGSVEVRPLMELPDAPEA